MKVFILLLIIISLPFQGFSQTTAAGLDIAGNAVEKNMGYSAVALSDDISGVSHNPAVIPNLRSINGSFTYFNYMQDFKMFYGNLNYPAFTDYNILGRVGYFYMPSETDVETGAELGYNEFFLGAGTGYKFLKERLSVGGIAHFYSATIAESKASTVFLNAGANYHMRLPYIFNNRFTASFSILNLGPGLKFDSESSPLPTNLNFGFQLNYNYDFRFFGGIRKYTEYEGFYYSIGGEVNMYRTIFLRGAIVDQLSGTVNYNLGIGFDLNYTDYHFLLDYAFIPLETYEATSVITLSVRFPFETDEERETEKNWKNMWTSE